MNQANPYAPSMHAPLARLDIRTVKIRPIELLKRGYRMLGDQYWLFLGITVVGMLIGSAVPMGLILGPMITGIYICYGLLERGERVEFSHVFKGFDSFKESFIAYLVILATAMVVVFPMMLIMFAVVFLPIISAGQNGGNAGPSPSLITTMMIFYPMMLLVNIAVAIPFLFTFQLISDRKMQGMEAVKASLSGVSKNLLGVVWYMIVVTLISVVLACMCYLPVFFFFPISFASIFLLYRDIFPDPTVTQQPVPENAF